MHVDCIDTSHQCKCKQYVGAGNVTWGNCAHRRTEYSWDETACAAVDNYWTAFMS